MHMDSYEAELKKKRKLLSQEPWKPLAQTEEVFHQKLSGTYLADIVFGANDGVITTFAVIAGAQGASLSRGVIIILGLANLIADGISMGAGNYLGSKSEIDYQKRQRQKEEWEVENFPEVERQEVREIYEKRGFRGKDLERAVEITTSDKKRWIDVMMLEELRIIEDKNETPFKRGVVTFCAFVAAGIIPVLAFIFDIAPDQRFNTAIIMAGITLFTVGALRSKVTIRHWFQSGIEMLTVGATAALAAYWIGAALQSIVGVAPVI